MDLCSKDTIYSTLSSRVTARHMEKLSYQNGASMTELNCKFDLCESVGVWLSGRMPASNTGCTRSHA